jgi:dolichol-phosphate mannosyltransferase
MKLSLIVSVYNEEQVLNTFYQTLTDILQKCNFDYELIFVNDGSVDSSQDIIDAFAKENELVKSILFSKNFGHEAAMIAGIDYATGDVLICMDSDLQHPPEMLPAMIDIFVSNHADIINMIRRNTKKNLFSSVFYQLLNKISSYDIEANSSDFFLISKRIAKILREDYRERVRFLRGFIQIIGFRRVTLTYNENKRTTGKSKYNFRKLLSLSIVAIATLSKAPLKISIYIGFISALLSILLVIYSIVMKIIEQPVSGYTTIVVFLGFMFSIQFFILGIIGEYIGFLFDEQKKRPIYIVDKTTNFKV